LENPGEEFVKVDDKKSNNEARKIIESMKVNLDPAARVMDLSIIEKNVGILKGKLRGIEIKMVSFSHA
jgi:ABC-type sugar transport system ATPase subunit